MVFLCAQKENKEFDKHIALSMPQNIFLKLLKFSIGSF